MEKKIIIPERLQREFWNWYMAQKYYDYGIESPSFIKWPFELQSGVYKSYLLSVNIIIEVRTYPYYYELDRFQPVIIQRHGLTTTLDYTINPKEAEVLAINAGLEIRAQRLEAKELTNK